MREYRVITMYSKELKRDVRIFIYLPKSYEKSEKYYPVLYMHDGHNLFDDKTASYGKSWGITEIYENRPELPEVIIVGLGNDGSHRNDELTPTTFTWEGMGEMGGLADAYLTFLLEKVKPYIDKRFRTFKSPKNTGIMGSSLGGVCSTYAAFKYTDKFTRFGCVSNAYHVIQDFMEDLAKKSNLKHVKKMYMDIGTKESSEKIINEDQYVEGNKQIYSLIKDKVPSELLRFEIVDGAEHNEAAWEKRFPDIINFLFND